ncbi:redoxin domain-containing protein [Azovibrio restrictus]|uniref:redoxin domain-containing protein n=1 Tax=Azovibrio restrictus TaxID=146938 RepID=UPI0026F0B5F8|nr:redoxin domain-containing protein [Azovibrio restrictus]
MSPSPSPSDPATVAASKPRWRRWIVEIALFLLALLAIQFWQTRLVPEGPAPAFTARLVDGSTITLDAWLGRHPGQPVALYFWADWCPVCKVQEGSIESLRQDWPVLTVAMQSGNAEQVAQLLRQRHLAWPTALDERGELARAYGLQGVPALIVVDARGRLRSAAVGYSTAWGMRLRLWWAGFAT